MHTRRGFVGIAAGVTLYGFSSDFWNKKDPSEWSSQEVEQLTTKSPWAKEISATAPPDYDRRSAGQSQGGQSPRTRGPINIPGIGGGGGGMGGGGGRGGGRGGSGGGAPNQSFKGTIRWESAKPILDGMKSKVPDAFTNHYVISVNGIPLSGRNQRSEDDPDTDRLKGVTFLQVKGKRDLQPGVVQQQTSSYGSVLFGFSKEMVTLAPDDKEVTFTTTFGRLNLKAKFNLKEMLYHGELAV